MRRVLLCLCSALFLTTIASSAGANLVVNGGFETGDFTGWNQPLGTTFNSITTDPVFEGTYSAASGPKDGPRAIAQDITTQVGATYRVEFELADPAFVGSGQSGYSVGWSGSELAGEQNPAPFGYTHFSFLVVGTGNDSLAFSFRHDPGFFYLDAVSVTLVDTSTSGTGGAGGGTDVPEPAGLAIFGLGLLGLGAGRYRHRA